MKIYKFYMQKTTKTGETVGSVMDLERDFPGLYYVKCEGLEAEGEPKNVYTEDYAEQNGPRVYLPSDVMVPGANNTSSPGVLTRKETAIKLTLLFMGAGRRATYTDFVRFVSNTRFFYWDTARNRKVWLFLQKPVEPDIDYIGDDGCHKAEFEFTNIWGEGKLCNDNGVIL